MSRRQLRSSRRCAPLFLAGILAGLLSIGGCDADALPIARSDRAPIRRVAHSRIIAAPKLLEGEPRLFVVEVTAREFGWRYRVLKPLENGDLEQLAAAENELHLPAETDVELRIASDDYVCTFAVPELRIRKLAVPELVFPLSVRTGAAGRFEVAVDSMCGMKYVIEGKPGAIVVESVHQFQDWIGACNARGSTSVDD